MWTADIPIVTVMLFFTFESFQLKELLAELRTSIECLQITARLFLEE